MKLILELHTHELTIDSDDLPAWVGLLDKATATRTTGYGPDKKCITIPKAFSISNVDEVALQAGTETAS